MSEDDGINTKAVQHYKRSLGENARRMLEIGIVQDELVKLGFAQLIHMCFENNNFEIIFTQTAVQIYKKGPNRYNYITYHYYYTSPTWQADILAKVKN